MHCVAVFVDVLHSIAFNCVHCGVFFGWDYTINKQENWMTISESKGRFVYKTNRIESIRITNRIESIRIANWNALVLRWLLLAHSAKFITPTFVIVIHGKYFRWSCFAHADIPGTDRLGYATRERERNGHLLRWTEVSRYECACLSAVYQHYDERELCDVSSALLICPRDDSYTPVTERAATVYCILHQCSLLLVSWTDSTDSPDCLPIHLCLSVFTF